MGMGESDTWVIRWLRLAPGVSIVLLGALYTIGAISIVGRLVSADIDPFVAMSYYSLEQVLLRGAAVLISGTVVFTILNFALGDIDDRIDRPYHRRIAKLTMPTFGWRRTVRADIDRETLRAFGWVTFVVWLALMFVIPFDGIFSVVAWFVLPLLCWIEYRRLPRRGSSRLRLLLAIGFLTVFSFGITAVWSASPLPEATVDVEGSTEPVSGTFAGQSSSGIMVATSDEKIDGTRWREVEAIPTGRIESVAITPVDEDHSHSAFTWLKDQVSDRH